MPDDKDEPPKVIPFGHELTHAVASDLREMYEGFVREKLPPRLQALAERLDQATRKKLDTDEPPNPQTLAERPDEAASKKFDSDK